MSDAILPSRLAMATSQFAVFRLAAFRLTNVRTVVSKAAGLRMAGLRWPSMRPGRRAGLLAPGLVIASLAGLAASVAVVTSLRAARPPVVAPVDATPPAPVWIDIVKPVQIYSLEARELAKLPSTYAARRLGSDVREDVLGFGTWHGDQTSLRLRILRGAGEASTALDTAIVRQAADVGVAIGPSKRPETLATRFGAFEVADVATTGPGAAMACSGFRLVTTKPAVAFDGFACGADGRPIARKTLACLIDRLDLASVGEDRALIDFFAATDLRRNGDCDGMRLAPDRVHAAWLDEKPAQPSTPTEGRSTSRRHHRHRH